MSDYEDGKKVESAGGLGAPRGECRSGNAWWEDRSLPQKVLIGIGLGILGIGLMAAFGWAVMALWNWLMPDLFGLKRIDYWKAWGLLALCTILFKGMGSSGGDRGGDRRRKRELRRYMREESGPAER